MDIGSGTGYPSANLSNFSPHVFTVDGIECNSMEGFLKFQDTEMQFPCLVKNLMKIINSM